MKIFIPLNCPSSKNSKQLVYKNAHGAKKCPTCGKIKQAPMFVDSKVTTRYKKNTEILYKTYAKKFREAFDNLPKPVVISFEFIRDSKRKFDYINPKQTVQDIMVKNGWITDDDADNIIPIPEIYSYNKTEPGVVITLNPDLHLWADRINKRHEVSQ